MSKRVNVQDTIQVVGNVDELQKAVELSESKVVMIDCHLDWCGPTTAILPFYNALWMEVEEPSDVMQPMTMNIANNPEILTKITPWCKAQGINIEEQGCKPLFLVLRMGHCVGAVDGCNTANFRMLVDLNLPKRKKKEDKK